MAELYHAERLPLDYSITGGLVSLFQHELELCKVEAGQHVLLHGFPDTFPHYPAAFMGAALALGADVFQVIHPKGAPLRAVVDAWKRADLVIEMSPTPMDYLEITQETLAAGGRILRVAMEEEVLRRLAPCAETQKRVEASVKILEAGNKLHITSPNGTDLTFYKGKRGVLEIYGVADKPGKWDIWPSGQVCVAPIEDQGDGVLVLAPLDVIKQFKRYVSEPVYLEIREGTITHIKGGVDAAFLNQYFRSCNDPNAYRIAHVGWGCERRCNWLKPGQDNAIFYGNMEIAFGSNVGVFPGARTLSRVHIDFPCLNNSFWVDELQVMERGEFVIKELV